VNRQASTSSSERFVPRRERLARNPRFAARMTSGSLVDLPTGTLKTTTAILIVLVVGFVLYKSLTGVGLAAFGGLLVIVAAALPGILWVTGVAKGYPIFPIFAFTYAYAFGLQILTNDSILESASTTLLIKSSLYLTVYLVLATVIWASIVHRPRQRQIEEVRIIEGRGAIRVLLILMAVFLIFNIAMAAGWLDQLWRFHSIMRAFSYSFGALSAFSLCYFMGKGQLTRPQSITFLLLLIPSMMAIASGLILIQTLGLWFLMTIGFILGSGRVPWKAILIILPIFVMLHYGKYQMRESIWETPEDRHSHRVQPWEYPSYYASWLLDAFSYTSQKQTAEDERPDLLERSSLLQLYLLVQELSPKPIPYMDGLTYSLIPQLLVPSVLSKDKMSVSMANAQISIHYGLQSEEGAVSTSIGWGLFNEAYANYGYFGQLGLAIVAGLFFGWVTKFTMGYPILSSRGLFAVIVMNLAFQSEFSSPHFVTVLFQSTVALVVLAFVLMRTEKVVTAVRPMTVAEFVERVAPEGLSRRLVRRVRVR